MHPQLTSLIQYLPKETLTIIKGNSLVLRNGDVYYPFRQDSDFFYLSGLSVPDLIITIHIYTRDTPAPGKDSAHGELQEVILWRDAISDHDRVWGSDKLSDVQLQSLSGIEDIRDRDDLEAYYSCHPQVCRESETQKESLECFVLAGEETWKPIVHDMRMIKTPEEIKKIQSCIHITQSIYAKILEKIHPGMYEYEVEAMIAHEFRREHGTEAFPSIVASEIHSCTLHYTANTRKIKTGDIVLIDFGIELDGYGADISRTFAVGGFSSRQQEIYDAVEKVKHFAEKTLKPKITRREWNIGVKNYMYDVCVGLGLKNIEKYTPQNNPYYPHSIGHFLGLDTHDVGDSGRLLEPGMILTIEPGIYIRDEAIGIRIEDDYLVTDDGCVKL